jgi:hypothetical protein
MSDEGLEAESTGSVPPEDSALPAHSAATPSGSSRPRALPWAIAAGIVAAGLTWAAEDAFVDYFKPQATGNLAAGPLQGFISSEALLSTMVKNAALVYGIQGAVLGFLLGLAGGLARRSAPGAIVGGLTGLVLAGALGAGAAKALFPWVLAAQTGPNPGDMTPPLVAHGIVWALLGGSAGLAFGLGAGGAGRAVRAAIGGLAGAVLGSVLYEVLGASLFPLGKTGDPVAISSAARGFAFAVVNLLCAIVAAIVADSAVKRPG